MTDNEIIKALACCLLSNEQQEEQCAECPMYESIPTICQNILAYHALDLINRQNAEIESLNEQERILICQLAEEREKAIKAFAERLKAEVYHRKNFGDLVNFEDIDALVKEMTQTEGG